MTVATLWDLLSKDTKELPQNKKKSNPMAVDILLCFSLSANIERLMRTGRSRDAIGCLDGMR